MLLLVLLLGFVGDAVVVLNGCSCCFCERMTSSLAEFGALYNYITNLHNSFNMMGSQEITYEQSRSILSAYDPNLMQHPEAEQNFQRSFQEASRANNCSDVGRNRPT